MFESEPKAPTFEMNPSIKALVAHKNFVCTPHLGASTDEAQIKVAHDIAFQVRRCVLLLLQRQPSICGKRC